MNHFSVSLDKKTWHLAVVSRAGRLTPLMSPGLCLRQTPPPLLRCTGQADYSGLMINWGR